MKHSLKVISTLMILCIFFIVTLEGCTKKTSAYDSNDVITIMAPLSGIDNMNSEDEIKTKLEDLTGEKINFIWIPKQVYKEKSTLMMSSYEYPDILVVENETYDIVDGAKKGAFYDITDYIGEYDNLKKCDAEILKNSSINNRVYGIYRYSNPVKEVIVLRKDYLKELGLTEPKTPEELENVLESFKNKCEFPLEIAGAEEDEFSLVTSEIVSYFGAANNWKEVNDKLIPDFMTKEYRNGLNYLKDLYNKNLLNNKFYLNNTSDSLKNFKDGRCGAIFTSTANAINLKNEFQNPDEILTVISGVKEENIGKKYYDKGYSGMLMFPKKGVKSEEKLKRVLSFLDKLNSDEGLEILNSSSESDYSNKLISYSEINTNVSKVSSIKNYESEFLNKINEIKNYDDVDKNVDISVSLKIEGNIKNADKITQKIEELNAKYIFNQIDEEQYEENINTWMSDGGQDYINEVNDLYSKSKE